jgi:hypothetical protein
LTRGYDVTSDHVNTTRTLCHEAVEVTGKHCSRCIIKRNNVTAEHRDVISSQDEVTVLGECSVITNTPVKYIMLLELPYYSRRRVGTSLSQDCTSKM